MILIDTCVWIWYASSRDESLSVEALKAIRDADRIAVSAISCWEIGVLLEKGRLKLDLGLTSWVQRSRAMPRFAVLPIDAEVAQRASAFGNRLHRDPADRMIVATAIEHGLTLVTPDKAIRNCRLVETLW